MNKYTRMLYKKILIPILLFLIVFIVFSSLFAQQNSEIIDVLNGENLDQKNGFLATFVRTPFILFCFLGTITGVMFSAIIEFFVNLLNGFECGYSNTRVIWDLGWNQLIDNWYWKPSVGWHVILSVIVWSPLLKRRKSKD